MELNQIKKVGIGSSNPVKVQAVKNFFAWLGKDDVVFESFKAPSSISDQPMSREETIQWAFNRAKWILQNYPDVDLAFWLEGGVEDVDTPIGKKMFLQGWTVAIDQDGKVGIGAGNYVELPEIVAQGLREGQELGPLMDKLLGTKGIKHWDWTVWLLTRWYLKRTQAFELQVAMAMSKWISDLW